MPCHVNDLQEERKQNAQNLRVLRNSQTLLSSALTDKKALVGDVEDEDLL